MQSIYLLTNKNNANFLKIYEATWKNIECVFKLLIEIFAIVANLLQ